VTPDGRVIYPLLQSTLKVWNALRAASEAHFLAEIVSTFSAHATLTAWDANLESYPIANCEASNHRTDSHDDAGGLVAQRQRGASTEVAIGKLLVI
jgi:hypothetical protein